MQKGVFYKIEGGYIILQKELGCHQQNNYMKFNEIIKNRIYPILRNLGFIISEEYDSVGFGSSIIFTSDNLTVNVTFDKREHRYHISISDNSYISYPLTDDNIEALFDIKIFLSNQLEPNLFVNNLYLLFQNDSVRDMLKGDITKLKEFVDRQAKKYTSKLIFEQELKTALKAWKNKDYKLFVEVLNKLNISELPQSYQLKYKIAKNKR
jgi:hypothetical protein